MSQPEFYLLFKAIGRLIRSHYYVIAMATNVPNQAAKTFFPNLDGLRTLACLAVFGFHGFLTILPLHTDIPRAFSVFTPGNMGVNFFFVLSGFLITYLLLEEEQRYQRIDIPGFYLRRVLRIWPLFFACIAYGFLVQPFLMHLLHVAYHERANGLLHVAFLGNLDSVWQGQQPTSHGLAVLWSVAIEEQFYLVWPLLLMVLFRGWRPGAFLLVVSISLAFRYAHSTNDFLIYRHSLAVMSDMAMGGAAAWASFRYPGFRRHIAGWSRWTIAGLYLAILVLLVVQKKLPETAMVVATQRLVRSSLFVFIILEQNYAANSWFKIKNNRLLTYWGPFTYGFYCLHPIVFEWLVFGTERLHLASTPVATIGRVLLALPLSLGLAWLSHRYLEQPFLRLKSRRQPGAGASVALPRLPAIVISEPTPTHL